MICSAVVNDAAQASTCHRHYLLPLRLELEGPVTPVVAQAAAVAPASVLAGAVPNAGPGAPISHDCNLNPKP